MTAAADHPNQPPRRSWEERHQFGWDALAVAIDYYSTLMEEWDD